VIKVEEEKEGEKKKKCCSRPLKICCAVTFCLLVLVGTPVAVYFFAILPKELADTFADEMSFYPCKIEYCTVSLVNGVCPTGNSCLMDAAGAVGSCQQAIQLKAQAAPLGTQDLSATFEVRMKNGAKGTILFSDGIDIPLEQLSLVIVPNVNGVISATRIAEADAAVTTQDYLAGGAAIACTMPEKVTLAKKAWSTVTLVCELPMTQLLDPLFATFLSAAYQAGTVSLPMNVTYGSTVEGQSGMTGFYTETASSTVVDIRAESGCPALSTVTETLNALTPPASSLQCASADGAGFLLAGQCGYAATAVSTSPLTGFLCCLAKTLDSLGIMLTVFLSVLTPTTLQTLIAALLPTLPPAQVQALMALPQVQALLGGGR